MAKRDPVKEQELIDFINRFYEENHRSPSVREIAANTSLQKSSVALYLSEMRDQGRIDYDHKMILTEQMMDAINDTNRVGIIGSVPCGRLSCEEENVEGYVNLPISIFGNGELYILHAYGDSMIGDGIDPGDLVVVRKQEHANNGDLVIAYVEGEGNTLKRYFVDQKHRRIILRPSNPDYSDIVVKDCVIQGVVRKIIKNVSSAASL